MEKQRIYIIVTEDLEEAQKNIHYATIDKEKAVKELDLLFRIYRNEPTTRVYMEIHQDGKFIDAICTPLFLKEIDKI